MPVDLSPVAATVPGLSLSTPAGSLDPVFEERWAAWMARGHDHDAAVRRTLRVAGIAATIALALAAVGYRVLGGSW